MKKEKVFRILKDRILSTEVKKSVGTFFFTLSGAITFFILIDSNEDISKYTALGDKMPYIIEDVIFFIFGIICYALIDDNPYTKNFREVKMHGVPNVNVRILNQDYEFRRLESWERNLQMKSEELHLKEIEIHNKKKGKIKKKTRKLHSQGQSSE